SRFARRPFRRGTRIAEPVPAHGPRELFMRLYEIVYIFDASLDEDAVTRRLEKYHELGTAAGGEVKAVDHWGVRQLAYPIDRKRTGYYVVAQLTAESDSVPELERVLKLDDDLLRFLLVLNEGEPTSGMSIVAQRPVSERADDDEDEDEDED